MFFFEWIPYSKHILSDFLLDLYRYNKHKNFGSFLSIRFCNMRDLFMNSSFLKWCGTLAGIVNLSAVTLALFLYSRIIPLDFFNMWISNLGIGPNGSASVFKTGLIIHGILLLCFSVGLEQVLHSPTKKAQFFARLAVLMQIIAGVSVILVGIYDMGSNLAVHVTAANLYFFPQLFTAMFTTISLIFTKKMTTEQWFFMGILIILTIIYLPVYLYSEFILFFHGAGFFEITFDQWVIMMGSMEPEMAWVRYIEWYAGTGLNLWLIQTGFSIVKMEKRQK